MNIPSQNPQAQAHILVVEDNADVLYMLGELLTILGHTFQGVPSAEEALSLLSGKDVFNILLTDITLPGMSGIELAKRIIENVPQISVVFTSGYGAIPADSMGFTFFSLPKPYTLMQLKDVLAKART